MVQLVIKSLIMDEADTKKDESKQEELQPKQNQDEKEKLAQVDASKPHK